MFYVDQYNEDNELICHTPFESKDTAINYFNLRCDSIHYFIPNWKRIEICEEKTVLFDYEV